jgi:peroxiredoxin
MAPAASAEWVAQPFTLRTPEGKQISLADYRGKILVLEFFASWCPHCHDAVEDLNELATKYPGKLEVLAVATSEEDPHDLPVFIEETKPNFPVLVDQTDKVARMYRVLMFPTYFVLNGEGKVESFHRGPVNWKSPKVQRYLERLVYPAPETDATGLEAPAAVTTVSLPR